MPDLPDFVFMVVEYGDDDGGGFIHAGPWDTTGEAKDEILPQLKHGERWMILKPIECGNA